MASNHAKTGGADAELAADEPDMWNLSKSENERQPLVGWALNHRLPWHLQLAIDDVRYWLDPLVVVQSVGRDDEGIKDVIKVLASDTEVDAKKKMLRAHGVDWDHLLHRANGFVVSRGHCMGDDVFMCDEEDFGSLRRVGQTEKYFDGHDLVLKLSGACLTSGDARILVALSCA